ncbi:MAG TPA: UDP-N-acetylmuramoyl-tripeptide--D-alanyl-D-alanine ligase [Methylomusa anaerophila]|nr:UDP-N-acetylmuramoyl-tripeptide--D-alanyl-D-alanine ligase [Methylomusa anaerophila]HML86903.1 UDP-N-acetylmuramoyl-tripeptide--D-alanyl-D-alanine ligase [Methylomusa anaerophila]
MAEFTAREVLKATGGKLIHKPGGSLFTGVSTDTRTIKPGNLFIALRGERFDGHEFVIPALEKGAAGLLVSRPDVDIPQNVSVILVNDTRKALQSLARFHRQRFPIPVVAVSGSNGKTTTKEMLAAVLSSRFKVLKTEANYNNEIGLPLTLLNLTPSHEAAVVEMGMRARGEIRELTEIALPTVGVVTNVGQTHIEILGSIENIALAKAELVESIKQKDLVVLNADDDHVRRMQDKTTARVVLYGLTSGAFVRAENIQMHAGEETVTTFDCVSPRGSFPIILHTVGKHNVYNALAAIAVGWELGLKPNEIKSGIASFYPTEMRQAITRRGNFVVINDVYNASPLSMKAAIETLADVAEGRKIAVLGDMLELGHVAAEAHRLVGEFAAEKGVDIIVTVGDFARYIADTAQLHGVKNVMVCSNHEEAKALLKGIVKSGDSILFKGSRGMKMEKVLEVFDTI